MNDGTGIHIGVALVLVMFAGVIAIVTVVISLGVRRRSRPRGFDVMERERHENQP